MKEASIHEKDRYVVLLWDEMKVKENLVFDKHVRQLTGFIDVGDIHNHLDNSERQCTYRDKNANANLKSDVSTHMLMFMVRGLLTDLEFPYALFSTKGASVDVLVPVVLEAVRRLESSGFKLLHLPYFTAEAHPTCFDSYNQPRLGGGRLFEHAALNHGSAHLSQLAPCCSVAVQTID